MDSTWNKWILASEGQICHSYSSSAAEELQQDLACLTVTTLADSILFFYRAIKVIS